MTRSVTRALFGRRAALRWVHLVLGGALLMPYWLLSAVLLSVVRESQTLFGDSLSTQFIAFAAALPAAALTALFPLTRPLVSAAARPLCGVPFDRYAEGPARTRAARVRTAGWFTLHLALGGLVSGATLALTPLAVVLVVLPPVSYVTGTSGRYEKYAVLDGPWALLLGPLGGAAVLVLVAAASAGAGALLARQVPALLGPTPADKLAAAERRAADLAVRNRLARELHDSVGHALSAVTLQASAARRVLDADPEFVREALAAIEETTRRTVGELDAVLGILRKDDDAEDTGAVGPAGPTLALLDDLLARCGVPVECERRGDPAAVPDPVSREAYRIVQEGLTNALRHNGGAPVSLSITVHEEEVEITMENPLSERAAVVRPGGGRGLRGMAERATLLGGSAAAGPRGDVWRLDVRLPLGGGR
ncbi:sensor histidine kinase [Streptomyces sp. NPDC050504]|uniref:sensor histidine kinase n=1 Tax=Streptomyces sp. NPDC050504 TaxID=3365618 RepID=UPI00379109F7